MPIILAPPPPPTSPVDTGPVTTAGERLYNRLTPVATYDAENGNVVQAIAETLAAAQQVIESIVRDGDTHQAWATAGDPDTAPAETLPWLHQLAGVARVESDTAEQERLRIKTAAGYYRGTTRAQIEDLQLLLTGARRVFFLRRDPDMWHQAIGVRDLLNEITNPSFETGTTGWAAYAAGASVSSFTSVIVDTSHGTHALRVLSAAALTAGQAVGGYVDIACVAGDQLAAAAEVLATNPASLAADIYIEWRTVLGGGSVISTVNGTDIPLAAGTSVRPSATGTAPGGTNGARVYVRALAAASTPAAVEMFIDGAVAVLDDMVPDYFDGDGSSSEWTGTPHASKARRLRQSVLTTAARAQKPAGVILSAFPVGGWTLLEMEATVTAHRELVGGVDTYVEEPVYDTLAELEAAFATIALLEAG